MKYRFAIASCTFTLLFVSSWVGCHSSQPPFVDFANRASWDAAKQLRWKTFQQTIHAQYFEPHIEVRSCPAPGQYELGPDTPIQTDFDCIEQRRTGNPNAISCRKAVRTDGSFSDYSNCSERQLAAELFQEDEESHGYK